MHFKDAMCLHAAWSTTLDSMALQCDRDLNPAVARAARPAKKKERKEPLPDTRVNVCIFDGRDGSVPVFVFRQEPEVIERVIQRVQGEMRRTLARKFMARGWTSRQNALAELATDSLSVWQMQTADGEWASFVATDVLSGNVAFRVTSE